MKIGRQTVESKETYEKLYRKTKNNAKIYGIITYLSILWEVWLSFQLDDTWIRLGASLGLLLRVCVLIPFDLTMWHENLMEGNRKIPPPILRPWLAIIQTILCVLLILSAISSIAPCIIYVVDYGGYVYTISLICCIFGAVGYSGLLHYLIKYFRYFRWTWEELQLPSEVRKEQYRTQKRLKWQKKAEAVKAKWQDFREAHFSGDEGKPQKPAAKTVKTQADRRAELENLKKLYEDGLIDEEEYRRAREKTLDI